MHDIDLDWFAGSEHLADRCLGLTYVLFVDTGMFPVVFSAWKTALLFQFCCTLVCKVQYVECCAESKYVCEYLSDM